MGVFYLCLIVHLSCVPVLDISIRALSGASTEISRTRHALSSPARVCLFHSAGTKGKEESVSNNLSTKGILYFMGTWGVGGVERVTAVLSNEWARRGKKIVIFAFSLEDEMLLSSIDSSVSVVIPNKGVMTEDSAKALRTAIEENDIGYVINDWSLPFKTSLFLRRVCKGLNVVQIVNLHNIPNNNARLAAARNPILRFAIRLFSVMNMHLTYAFCARYVLLSESFKPIFKRFAFVPFGRKLSAITNPLTLEVEESSVEKENILLYVGRLEEKQKCFSRIANLWKNCLAERHPAWRLEVVGDGPDREAYEKMLEGVPRVVFHGFQPPAKYYQKSKLLVMTSAFEGFPLVLAEAMSAGCVPIALGSFPAVYDIINGRNGRVVQPPYDEKTFADKVSALMADESLYSVVAENARTSAQSFSVEKVVDEWESLLKGL